MTVKIVPVRAATDIAANWASVDPIPKLGEACVITDTGYFKWGDGVNPFSALPLAKGAVAWGAVTGTLSAQTDLQEALDGKLDDSQLDTDGTFAANSDARIPSQKAVKTYADALIAAQDAMVFKGVIDCSTNPNYPAADRGHTYRVSVAGKIGGGSGVNVEVGDLLLCLTDSTSAGTQAAVGSNWSIIQTNLDGVVVGPSSATDGGLAAFDGTTGKLLKAAATTGTGSAVLASSPTIGNPVLTGTAKFGTADPGVGTVRIGAGADALYVVGSSLGNGAALSTFDAGTNASGAYAAKYTGNTAFHLTMYLQQNGNGNATVELYGVGTGDSSLKMSVSNSTTYWTLGIDNSDSDAFVIAASSALGTSNVMRLDASTKEIRAYGPVSLASYTVATVPAASTRAGAMIFVSNESGGAVPAFSDGTDWRRVTDRAVIS